MKKYLLQLFGVGALFLGINLLFPGTKFFILKDASFKTDERKNILVLGDSHTAYSINDQILERSLNASKSASHYASCNIILEKIVKDNPQIDTLLLSFHSKSLTRKFSDRMEYYIPFRMKDLIYYTKPKHLEDIPWKFSYTIELLRSNFKSSSSIIKTLSHKPITYGGFSELKREKLYEDIELFGDEYIKEKDMEIDTTTSQYSALRKIEMFCREKNIKLILVNCPTYQPEIYTNPIRFDSMRVSVLPEMDYLDFSDFELPDSCYSDIDHLNHNGARIFSEYLQQHGLNR